MISKGKKFFKKKEGGQDNEGGNEQEEEEDVKGHEGEGDGDRFRDVSDMTSMGGAIHPGQLGTANQSQGLGTSPMLSKAGSKHKK